MAKSKNKSNKVDEPASTGLSSFLLGVAPTQDSALDDIFATSKGATKAFEPKKELPAASTSSSSSKKSKGKAAAAPVEAEEEAGDANDAELSELASDPSLGDLDLESDEEAEDGEDGVEEAYAARLAAERIKAMQGNKAGVTAKGTKRKAEEELDSASSGSDGEEEEEQSEGDEEDFEDEDDLDLSGDGPLDINDLVLGSLKGEKKGAKDGKKSKKETQEKARKSEKALKRAQETPEERDARTVFLGNVPAECSTSKSLKKALVRHVLQSPSLTLPPNCPPLKLDSIRFRSLAFASKVFGRKATTPSATDDGEPAGGEAGGRGRKRAREWRETEGSDERGVRGGFHAKEEGPKKSAGGGKTGALTDAQKRRVAFIRGELNENKKACNAYLVLAALPEEIDVRAVIQALVNAADNSIFEGSTLHADVVRPRSAAAVLAAAQMAAKPNMSLTDVPRNAETHQVSAQEAKRTLFVGGLDFAETEENVRKATEAVLVRERGDAGEKSYVESVRVVRDASTGLGKGFCYVLLQDEQCVDELLALPPGKNLKISKRKVRLERCKTTAAAARSKAQSRTASASTSGPSSSRIGAPKPVRLAAPRDPSLRRSSSSSSSGPQSAAKQAHQAQLAEALAKLPTDERKKIKSMDAERIARRAQKKEQKRLSERYERKQANVAKKSGGGVAGEVLGRVPRAMERKTKEKKRIRMQSKSTLKKKSAR
ncbi:hypothetical protein JCM8547_008047 [Rhodosporidiobolus lusitaniae]